MSRASVVFLAAAAILLTQGSAKGTVKQFEPHAERFEGNGAVAQLKTPYDSTPLHAIAAGKAAIVTALPVPALRTAPSAS